ncbi:MAG: DUF1629 domain-containing protein [Fuerstiella sp.]
MTDQFYRMSADFEAREFWDLGIEGDHEIAAWEFLRPGVFRSKSVALRIEEPGLPADFNETAFGVPLVSQKFMKTIEPYVRNDVKFIPVKFDRDDKWYVLHVRSHLPCLDFENSRLEFRDDGEIAGVRNLCIDSRDLQGRNIVRPQEWPVAIVCRECVMLAAQKNGLTGFVATRVS